MSEEREQPKTIEWYKAQAKELADIRKIEFTWARDKGDDCDEYFPDKVARKYKKLLDETKYQRQRADGSDSQLCWLADWCNEKFGIENNDVIRKKDWPNCLVEVVAKAVDERIEKLLGLLRKVTDDFILEGDFVKNFILSPFLKNLNQIYDDKIILLSEIDKVLGREVSKDESS